MDIIEIDSAESEDDIDRAWSDCVDRNHDLEMSFQNCQQTNNNDNSAYPESLTSSRRWAGIPDMNLGNTDRSNGRGGTSHVSYKARNDPQLNGHQENTQKRTLPSSFQSFTSRPSFDHSSRSHGGSAHSQQKEPKQVPSSDSQVVDVANYRSKFDNKSFQHTQKRILPPSLQPSVHKNASEGHVDYNKGRKNMSYEFGADD